MSGENASDLREQAARCLRLAKAISDTRARDALKRSAEEFESEAEARDAAVAAEPVPPPRKG